MNTAGRDPPAIEPIPVPEDENPVPPGVAMAAGGAPFVPDTQGAGIAADEPSTVEDDGGAATGGVSDSKHVTASTPDELALFKNRAQVCG